MAGLQSLSAQTRYLVNTHTPVDSHCYTAYKYTGPSSKRIAMSGGLDWCGGFTLKQVMGSEDPGYATFRLGGRYDKLMFVLGHANTNTGAGGTGIDTEARIFTVYVDGRKVVDELVYPYGIPKRMTIDVAGADELKFVLVRGEGPVAVAEATLWTAGQTPVETGNIIRDEPRTRELVKDIRPYFQNNRLVCVSPSDKTRSLKVNGREYEYGLSAYMNMAIIGNNPGWAYFNLRGQYSKLSFIIGPVDNTEGKSGSGWFTVKADGKIIYEKEMTHDDIAQSVTLDVKGCDMLSFHSEQSSGSTNGALTRIMVYPEGEEPKEAVASGEEAPADPRLKSLPDVCKLISNIPPYAAGAQTRKQIYDGSSDYITFSMGGVKFSEGIVFYEKTSVMSDNTSAYAVFDLGNEFDYVSFIAGYIGKSGAMNNDILRVYADDELVMTIPLVATYPNQKYTVPINRCRKLRFENQGSATLDVAAYGIADIVVYRGKPVENDLFVHPEPECPHTVDLIDLGPPYIHYVSPMSDHKDEIFYDGSTQRKYFDLNGKRIYKGFMLQTSVHFSLDHGELSGTDGAAAGALGGAAVGSAFVAGGVAVGGAVVGSTLVGAAAMLMLAAGGEALENSCAAFNTYGEYNTVTFTVACCRPHINADDYKETLLIGADHKVVAQLTVYETMEPQTVTVPIDGCHQLMFWLANTDNWSGQYIFYDIKLTKDRMALDIPKAARLSEAVITRPQWCDKTTANKWIRPSGASGQKSLDSFLTGISNAYDRTMQYAEKMTPKYEVHTYYLESASGSVCKAVKLKSDLGDVYLRITSEFSQCLGNLKDLDELRKTLRELSLMQANAALSLPALGFNAIGYEKLFRHGCKVLKECREMAELMYAEKLAETEFLRSVLDNAMLNIDGKQSTEKTVFSELLPNETPPADGLQMVEHFVVE